MYSQEDIDLGIAILKQLLDKDAAIEHTAPIRVEVLESMKVLLVESDRGCVLVATSILDNLLEKLLRARLVTEADVVKKAVDPLFKGGMNTPLGSFSARCKLSYALGLIDHYTFEALEVMRRLRNAFAHDSGPATLDDPRVVDMIEKLKPHQQIVILGLLQSFQSGLENAASDPNWKPKVTLPEDRKISRIQFIFAVGQVEANLIVAKMKCLALV